jgi:TPR repeat protein
VGIGTPRDMREALDWFRRAAELGDKRAVARLKQYKQSVPPVGKSRGSKAARAEILDRDDPNVLKKSDSGKDNDCIVS